MSGCLRAEGWAGGRALGRRWGGVGVQAGARVQAGRLAACGGEWRLGAWDGGVRRGGVKLPCGAW